VPTVMFGSLVDKDRTNSGRVMAALL